MATNTEPQWYQNYQTQQVYVSDQQGYTTQPIYSFTSDNDRANNITLNAGSEEMIKVTKDGFYVRGQLVPQDEKEAKEVYAAFREWLTWATLNRQ